MKGIAATALLLVWPLLGTGCIAVLAGSTKVGITKEVVAVDGRVYVIDKQSGSAREIDLAVARPFDASETPASDVND